MLPIGRSSCYQTLNSKAFGMLPIKIGKLSIVENASIGVLKTTKEETKKDNQYKLNKAMASPLA